MAYTVYLQEYISGNMEAFLVMKEWLSEIEERFREALKNKDLHVWYQPQVDMRTGDPKGAEALVRWQKQDGGLILPGFFVPFLERLELTVLLDTEVMRIVCRDICEARERGIPFGPVSVNLSGQNAGRTEIQEQLCRITEQYGITQKELAFEITETVAEDDEEKMQRFADDLREDGYRIAMDDYGMGNSTLKLLQEIHFDILKLDRHFVSRIGDPRADIILASTIGMAEKLKLEVVAEGVETEEQIRFLVEHQCHFGQGYYYSEPLPKDRYIRWRKAYEEAV